MKIVNRIVTALLAATAFPLLITQLFFTIVLSINEESLAYSLINAFAGQGNMLTGNRLGFQESLWSIFQTVTGQKDSTLDFDFMEIWSKLPPELDTAKKLIIASLVFVAVGALIALVIIGCAIFTKAYKTIIGLGTAGFASFLTGIILFNQAGKPIVEGTIDAVDMIAKTIIGEGTSSTLGAIAASVLQGTISVDTFSYGGAVFGAMIMMIAVVFWELAYFVTLPENEKPHKKIKKA